MPARHTDDNDEPESTWYSEKTETDDTVDYRLNRRQFFEVAGSLTGVSLLTGYSGGGGGDDTPIEDLQDDGSTTRLTIALPSEIWQVDPAYMESQVGMAVSKMLFASPVELTPDLSVEPWLSPEVPEGQDNSTVFEYKVRDGLTFHNGDPLTAEAYKANWDWVLNPDNDSLYRERMWYGVESVDVVDDLTVRVNLNQPRSDFNNFVAASQGGMMIARPGAREQTQQMRGPVGLGTAMSTDATGDGSGPFQFVEWNSGRYLHLEKFDNFWRDGYPKVDELRFTFINENSTRLAQLQSGQTDIAPWMPIQFANQMRNQSGINIKRAPGRAQWLIYCNLIDPPDGENPMSNLHNRRAVSYAINRREILDQVFQGEGVLTAGLWYPDSDWTSDRLKQLSENGVRDLDKAREELEMAGNPDGFQMQMLSDQVPASQDQATLYQQQLQEVGIELEINTVDHGTFFDILYGNNTWHTGVASSTFGAPSIFWWLNDGFVNNNHNHNHWHHPSDDIESPNHPSGPPAPEDAEGDYSNAHEWFVAQVEEARSTTDAERQREIVHLLDEYIFDNAIQIHACIPDNFEGVRSNVSDYRYGSYRAFYEEAGL